MSRASVAHFEGSFATGYALALVQAVLLGIKALLLPFKTLVFGGH